MSNMNGLHLLWIDDETSRFNLAGPFATENAARLAAPWCHDQAVLVNIEFIDDPTPLLTPTPSSMPGFDDLMDQVNSLTIRKTGEQS